jgi:protein TonB
LALFRFPIALFVALGVSVGMFWGLRAMIGVSGALEQIQRAPRIDFVRLRRDTEVEEKVRVKPEFTKPEPRPAAPDVIATQKTSVIAGTDIAALAPSVDFSGVGGGIIGGGGGGGLAASLAAAGGSDRGCVPQVRIQPDYPIQARQKGIEGWVAVQFTVGTDGSTRNVVALDAEPKSIFDSAAVQAVKGWKYSPKIHDGRAVDCGVQQVRIRFELET